MARLLPSNVPQVILDAMTVTLNLGHQYLWVDKYCISQNAGSEKHEQVRNMDVIYRDACLTIIVASGEPGCHSLPGFSRPRVHQPQVSIGEGLYVSPMPDPLWVIRNSCWATRGWTYQEALLSRRRLVFTDHQVYF
jgi:Heterokaryon incompatibility protein (HET)